MKSPSLDLTHYAYQGAVTIIFSHYIPGNLKDLSLISGWYHTWSLFPWAGLQQKRVTNTSSLNPTINSKALNYRCSTSQKPQKCHILLTLLAHTVRTQQKEKTFHDKAPTKTKRNTDRSRTENLHLQIKQFSPFLRQVYGHTAQWAMMASVHCHF